MCVVLLRLVCPYGGEELVLNTFTRESMPPQVKPTIFFGVPRVYEKIMEQMQAVGRSKPAVLQCVVNWAKRIGSSASAADAVGAPLPWGFTAASVLFFNNIRRALGLQCCRGLFSGPCVLCFVILASRES